MSIFFQHFPLLAFSPSFSSQKILDISLITPTDLIVVVVVSDGLVPFMCKTRPEGHFIVRNYNVKYMRSSVQLSQ